MTGNPESKVPWYIEGLSEYRRIKARLAWVLRFIGNCRRNAADRDTGKLSVRDWHNRRRGYLHILRRNLLMELKTLESAV